MKRVVFLFKDKAVAMRHQVDIHRSDIADRVVAVRVSDPIPLGAAYQSGAGISVPSQALMVTAPDVLLKIMLYSERCIAVPRGSIPLPREE